MTGSFTTTAVAPMDSNTGRDVLRTVESGPEHFGNLMLVRSPPLPDAFSDVRSKRALQTSPRHLYLSLLICLHLDSSVSE